jgi:hypothetical protein
MTAPLPRIEDEKFRQRVCAWLRANGVDPARTPMYPQASIADGQLTLLQWAKGPDGRTLLNETRTAMLEEAITVPVLVMPDHDVAEWLKQP